MPQMMPMNWLMLMAYFMMLFLIFNSMNYFSLNYIIKTNKKMILMKEKMNWKW